MAISMSQRDRLDYLSTWYKITCDQFKEFIEYINTLNRPDDLHGSLDVSGQDIEVKGYGYTAKATPRVVSDSDGCLAIELKFSVKVGEDDFPIKSIYFSEKKLRSSLNGSGNHICDAQNHLVVRRILEEVLTSLVESTLFKPE